MSIARDPRPNVMLSMDTPLVATMDTSHNSTHAGTTPDPSTGTSSNTMLGGSLRATRGRASPVSARGGRAAPHVEVLPAFSLGERSRHPVGGRAHQVRQPK